jgi:quinoprotein dehydrogenase-associated probable ABC transporter substrate-binding protein
LPFSNDRGEGFENAIAELVAKDLGLKVRYMYFPQRRGFIRNTLRAKQCDVVIGVPRTFEMVETTAPYYRSTYVFVTRKDRAIDIRSFDDEALKRLRVGIHFIGDDYANVPPAEALAARGIVDNVRGYSIYGNYSDPDPPRALIDAVARDEIDVAIAWGPLAGYFAKHEPEPLSLVPVPDEPYGRQLAMSFDISMGVRHGDTELRTKLDRVLARRRSAVRQILTRYGVPIVEPARTSASAGEKLDQ